MHAWNAEHAAVIARLMQFQWSQALAVLLLSSTPCWGEKAANALVPSNRTNQGKVDVAADANPHSFV
jgi:hypothetical protein